MEMYNLIKNRLVDDESKLIFDARISLIQKKSLSEFYSHIRENNRTYRVRDVERFESTRRTEAWIIWGTDDAAVYSFLLLRDTGRKVIGCVGEESMYSQKWCVPLITEVEAKKLVHHGKSILASQKDKVELLAFPQKNTLFVEDHLVGRCGWQYFDFFEPFDNEIFFDGGSLDGRTSFEFEKWCKGRYLRIYAVEPNPLVQEQLKINTTLIGDRIVLNDCALWDHSCDSFFSACINSPWDAHLSSEGQYEVRCDTIDNILSGQPVTFIKLDVEGAEKEALRGAKGSIKNYKPRLAVSIYHNLNDCIEVITYLMRIVPDYKFAIRHYHSDLIETVLYAFV